MNAVERFMATIPHAEEWPVVKRDAHSIHFERPDGRYEAYFVAGEPLHKEVAQGQWEPIQEGETLVFPEGVLAADFPGHTADAAVYGQHATYATARSTSTVGPDDVQLYVGQDNTYSVYRSFLKFDTASLDDAETIDRVRLTLTASADGSTTDFDVQIVKQNWSAQDPLTAGNREAAYDNCLSGTADNSIWRNTTGIATQTPYTSGNLDTTWVSRTGNTYYSLRSNRDLDNTTPTTSEWVVFYSGSEGIVAYRPTLAVIYFVAPTVTGITPAIGHISGGLKVTITGTNFYGAPNVTIGGRPAGSATLVNTTTITAITPPVPAGVVNVGVTTPSGTGTLTSGFTASIYPQVITADTSTGSVTSNSNSWTITYPANVQTGDLLVWIISIDGTANLSPLAESFQSLHNPAAGSNQVVGYSLYKWATAAHTGNFTQGLTGSEQGSWAIFRVTGVRNNWNDRIYTIDGVESAGGDSDVPDPPNLSVVSFMGSVPITWTAAIFVDRDRSVTATPSNMTGVSNSITGAGANGATLGWKRHEATASAFNPLTFTVSAADEWGSATLAFRGASAVYALQAVSVADTPTLAVVSASGDKDVSQTQAVGVATTPSLTVSAPQISKSDAVGVADSPVIRVESFVTLSDAVAVADTPTLAVIRDVYVADGAGVADAPTLATSAPQVSVGDAAGVADAPIVDISTASSVSDAVGVADVPLLSTDDLQAAVSDGVSVADAPTLEVIVGYEVIDSVTVVDTPIIVPGGAGEEDVSESESVAVAESLSLYVETETTVADAVGVAESVEVATSAPQPIVVSAVTVAPTELLYVVTATDSVDAVAVADEPTLAASAPQISAAESIAVADSPEVDVAVEILAAESVSAADSPILSTDDLQAIVSDGVGVADAPTVDVLLSVEVSDGVTAADAPTLSTDDLQAVVSDAVGVADAPTVDIQLSVEVSDGVSVAETQEFDVPVNLTAGSSVAVIDSPTIAVLEIGGIAFVISDAVGVAATPTLSTDDLQAAVADAVGVADAPTISTDDLQAIVSDAVTAADSPLLSTDDLLAIVSDAVGVADSLALDIEVELSASETILVDESISLSVFTPAGINVEVSDGVGVVDSLLIALDELAIQASEAVGAAESVVLDVGVSIYQTLTVNVTEVVSGSVTASLASTQGIVLADNATLAVADPQAVVSETVGVADSGTVTLVVTVSVADGITVVDSLAAEVPILLGIATSISIGESHTLALDDQQIAIQDTVSVAEIVAVELPVLGPTLYIGVSDAITIGDLVTLVVLTMNTLADRVYMVAGESRVYGIEAEERMTGIRFEKRTFSIGG